MVSLRVPFRRRVAAALVLAATALSVLAPAPASAAALPLQTWATGLSKPVFVSYSHPGNGRLFIVEQPGVIKVKQAGQAGAVSTFLDIRSRVLYGGEQGLLSIAFHPDFASTDTTKYGRHRFYVNFTDNNGNIAIEEFRTSSATANTASAGTARRVMTIAHPGHANHNGGQVAFGPDRYLYISTGDGGGSGDPGENGQDRNSLLGKILRVGVQPLNGRQYWIPSSNPFYGSSRPGRGEVWSYGLRNPWRFAFDFARNDMWVADVGQNRYEEVNVSRSSPTTRRDAGRGTNYGWDRFEGNACFEGPCDRTGIRFPARAYSHSYGCSISGGFVDRRSGSSLYGRYIFGDFCSGHMWSVSTSSPTTNIAYHGERPDFQLVSFGQGADGYLYLVQHGSSDDNGVIYRINS